RGDVRIVVEPGFQVATERLDAARCSLPPRARWAGKVLADGLAVPAGMPRDRGLRPAASGKRVYLHVVLLGQHPPRSSSLVMASRTGDGEGDPRQNGAHAPGHDSGIGPPGLTHCRAPARQLTPSQGG